MAAHSVTTTNRVPATCRVNREVLNLVWQNYISCRPVGWEQGPLDGSQITASPSQNPSLPHLNWVIFLSHSLTMLSDLLQHPPRKKYAAKGRDLSMSWTLNRYWINTARGPLYPGVKRGFFLQRCLGLHCLKQSDGQTRSPYRLMSV